MESSVPASSNVDFIECMKTGVIPDFEGKGLYRTYDKSWNPVGYSEIPQYKGQMPTTFPEYWSPILCALFKSRKTE